MTKKRWCLVLWVGMVVVEIAVGSGAEIVVMDVEIAGVEVVAVE